MNVSPIAAAGADGFVCAIYGVWPLPKGGSQFSDGQTAARQEPGSKSEAKKPPEVVAPIRVICSIDHERTFAQPSRLGERHIEIELTSEVNVLALSTIAAALNSEAVYAAFVAHQAETDHTDLVLSISDDRGRT